MTAKDLVLSYNPNSGYEIKNSNKNEKTNNYCYSIVL